MVQPLSSTGNIVEGLFKIKPRRRNNMTERFHIIDGETLMNQPLSPIRFVVEGLLSHGLHLLAGAPKSGKSWLALWLSVTVAKGEEVWGGKVQQGTTLYLCFEDSRLRIQNRLFDITGDVPPNVHFCEESVRLGEGLESASGSLSLSIPIRCSSSSIPCR